MAPVLQSKPDIRKHGTMLAAGARHKKSALRALRSAQAAPPAAAC